MKVYAIVADIEEFFQIILLILTCSQLDIYLSHFEGRGVGSLQETLVLR